MATKVYVPADTTACALGADEVAAPHSGRWALRTCHPFLRRVSRNLANILCPWA